MRKDLLLNSIFLFCTHMHTQNFIIYVLQINEGCHNSLTKFATLKTLVNCCKTKAYLSSSLSMIGWTSGVTVILNCIVFILNWIVIPNLVQLSEIVHQVVLPWRNFLRFFLFYSTLKNRWTLLAKSDLQHIKWRVITSIVIYRGMSNSSSPGLRPD